MLSKLYKWYLREQYKKRCNLGYKSVFYSEAELVNNQDKEQIAIGTHTHIRGQLLTFGHGGRINIGDYCYVGRNTYIWSAKAISIGNRVLISHNCNIFDNDTHPLNPEERHLQFKEIITSGQPKSINLNEKEITIEDDVLIAANCTILKGVHIGKAAVIAANSVVTKDVAAWTVVAGNPAKFIKEIQKSSYE